MAETNLSNLDKFFDNPLVNELFYDGDLESSIEISSLGQEILINTSWHHDGGYRILNRADAIAAAKAILRHFGESL